VQQKLDSVILNKIIVEDNIECALNTENCVFQQEPVFSIFQKKRRTKLRFKEFSPTRLINKVFD
jgi:CRISPR/Cas system-associated endonuclease Cas3-HD